MKERQLLIVSHNIDQFYQVTATNLLGCKTVDSIEVKLLTKPIFQLPEVDTVCFKGTFRIAPLQLLDTLQTEFSWRSSDPSINLTDSIKPHLTINPAISARYILSGRNNCVTGGIARDTFNIHVIEDITADHSFTFLNDELTVAPVKFTTAFSPLTFQRTWRIFNDINTFDTLLLGLDPTINFRKGGNYTSEAIVYSKQGTRYCADTVSKNFLISPLGSVFLPTLITDNEDSKNSTFLVTARDENGNILREINEGKIIVFNRWGKVVYENDRYNNDLNYSTLKSDLSDGIYFYEYSVARYNYKAGGWFRIQR